MKGTIREAEPADISALCVLMAELGGRAVSEREMANRLRMIQVSAIDTLYVYEEDGKVWGALAFRIRENIRKASRYGEICVIVVKAERKRTGVGREMMAFAETKARELGCIATYLISGFGRADEAHRFYRDLGYDITGYRFVKPLDRSDEDEPTGVSH